MGVPLNIDWQQILLHLFNFAVLAGGLHFLLYKPVKAFMEQRTEHFKSMEKTAEDNLAQAQELKEEYGSRLRELDNEISEKRMNAKKETDGMVAAQLDEAKAQAAEIISNARKTAELEREKLFSDAQQELVSMVMTAAEKVILDQSVSVAYDQFLSAAEREEFHA